VTGSRLLVHAHADRAHRTAVLLDGVLVRPEIQLAGDERKRILFGVRSRNDRRPVQDLRILACLVDRGRVVFPPRSQNQPYTLAGFTRQLGVTRSGYIPEHWPTPPTHGTRGQARTFGRIWFILYSSRFR
jgi:hypothetical protein